ncbi:hypothetical protein EVAR_46430_1 [Eumeta japonica]|uniref:Uncharacterized protein n=1 Tax=Eumeta variegata TaxID=151549 RepID=A0A4C1XH05_EUMVA|nr:hypothetical protein EVAR_46430_1 [Eumeta japonica]
MRRLKVSPIKKLKDKRRKLGSSFGPRTRGASTSGAGRAAGGPGRFCRRLASRRSLFIDGGQFSRHKNPEFQPPP